uniref:Uncharacterized protein n=1 Tax=Lepeophtheirus salmonis TaxID=72036 RepID=A0A0K2U8N2_LEPSM
MKSESLKCREHSFVLLDGASSVFVRCVSLGMALSKAVRGFCLCLPTDRSYHRIVVARCHSPFYTLEHNT